jgi:very-short-patch-repair endonuclease
VKWKSNEIEYIKNNINKSNKEISEKLNRSIHSIIYKKHSLNLKNKIIKKEYKCLNCNNSIFCNRLNVKYCSRKCKSEYLKKTKYINICIVCGKEFETIKSKKHKYCSKKCFHIHSKTGKIINCEYCGKEVYRLKNALKKHRHSFCSLDCANEFQKCKCKKIELICEFCGKTFLRYPSEVKSNKIRGYTKSYCSNKCKYSDPNRILQLIKINNNQSKNKELNKLEKFGSEIIKKLNIEFIEQYLINNKITVDVYIPKSKLIVQWWGNYWHGHPNILKDKEPNKSQSKRMVLDKSQDKYLKKCGYNILYFWESDVYKNPDDIFNTIKERLI